MTTAEVIVGPMSGEEVAERLSAIEQTFAREDRGGICVCDGFGVRVAVERGALEVSDGIGPHRRTRRYDKATHGLARLVVLNASGNVSLAALRWCQALAIGVVVIGPDGRALLTSAPRVTDDARIRRAQALAPSGPIGLDVAALLLGAKLAGQAKLLRDRFGDAETAATIEALGRALEAPGGSGAGTGSGSGRPDGTGYGYGGGDGGLIAVTRQLEASAAALYFNAWAGRPECAPVFVTADRRRIPPHWTTYETRRSVLASVNSNRRAERPANALLNYGFALLEAEAILACHAVGLDPGLGIVHADTRSRASMALDLVEPVRPEVERFVLDLLASRTFHKVDFVETPDGGCRIAGPLAHDLAESLPRWREALAPWAERVAHMIGATIDGAYTPATPLTRARTKAAQDRVKARRATAPATETVTLERVRSDLASTRATKIPASRQRPPDGPSPLPLGCVECGQVVSSPRRVRCDDCLAADPAQAPEVRSRRGRAIASRKQALRARGDAGLAPWCDAAWFAAEVLPGLASVKLVEIMEAAGCSKSFASQVRSGKFSPHVSTWRALANLAGVEAPDEAAGAR